VRKVILQVVELWLLNPPIDSYNESPDFPTAISAKSSCSWSQKASFQVPTSNLGVHR